MWQFFSSQSNSGFTALVQGNSLIAVGVFLLVWAILWLPWAVPLALFLKWHPRQPLTIPQKLSLMAPLYLLAPLVVWGAAKLKGVSFTVYGLSWNPSLLLSLSVGLGLGIAGLAVVFTLEGFCGWIQWHPENRQRLLSVSLPLLGLGLWIGGTEELIFRGFFLNELRQDYSLGLAAALSSGIFALLHLVWEREKTLPQLPGLWVMGMVLVAARLVDGGSLGLAWGLHAGWIWGLSSLDAAGLMQYTGKGASWIVGLGEQPLAGVAGIGCLLGTGVLLWGVAGRF